MYNLKPVFYDKFECQGDRCLYTCCGGWGIPFTSELRDKYLLLNHENVLTTEDLFVKSATHDNYFIKFNEKRMCPLCNEKQLCSLVIQYGPEVLDGICKDFPRVDTVLGTMDEFYLSLGCPYVIELLCKDSEILSFILEEDNRPSPIYSKEDEEYVLLDMQIRDKILDFLQDRELPLKLRIFYAAFVLEKITCLRNEDTEYTARELKKLLGNDMVMAAKQSFLQMQSNSFKQEFEYSKLFLDRISSRIRALVFDDNFSTKTWVNKLLEQNSNCTYEQWLGAYTAWMQHDSERYNVMTEKMLTYNWMLFSLNGISEEYFWDNYLIAFYEVLAIKQMHILYYMLYEQMPVDVSYVLGAIVERCISHGRKDILSILCDWKQKGVVSVEMIGQLCMEWQ